MTNEEAATLLNGNGGEQSQAAAGNSEPKSAGTPAQETPATVAENPEPQKDTVKTESKTPKATEAGDGRKQDSFKKKNFYSQQRAQHEFARQNRRMQSLQRENEELKAQIEKFKSTTRDTFVDKVSGKLDEEGYMDFLATKKAAEQQSQRLEKETKELQDDQEEAQWLERVDRELGEDAEKFNAFCNEIVDDAGSTRFQKFVEWLERRDPYQVIASRVNATRTGVQLLKRLMEDKDARMSVISAGTPHLMELALDRVSESLGGAKTEKPEGAKQTTFAESWKAHRKETVQQKPKPSGSAFSGETKSAGKVVKDNAYFASLL